MLNIFLRSRWFSAVVHAGLWLMLLLIITGMGKRTDIYRESRSTLEQITPPVPAVKLEELFSPGVWPKQVVNSNQLSAFATTNFFAPPPTPPPPPARPVMELTYQGYFQTAGSPKRVLIRLGDSLRSVPVGGMVTSNFFVAEATGMILTLTNSTAQTNLLSLNKKKIMELPSQ